MHSALVGGTAHVSVCCRDRWRGRCFEEQPNGAPSCTFSFFCLPNSKIGMNVNDDGTVKCLSSETLHPHNITQKMPKKCDLPAKDLFHSHPRFCTELSLFDGGGSLPSSVLDLCLLTFWRMADACSNEMHASRLASCFASRTIASSF